MNDEQTLLDALRRRAAADARAFRDKFRDDVPNERWLDNSYTAALALAKEDAGFDLGPGPHPHLFDAYRREVTRFFGRGIREDRERGEQLEQQPTRGEA
jgi:hypothetical protein